MLKQDLDIISINIEENKKIGKRQHSARRRIGYFILANKSAFVVSYAVRSADTPQYWSRFRCREEGSLYSSASYFVVSDILQITGQIFVRDDTLNSKTTKFVVKNYQGIHGYGM